MQPLWVSKANTCAQIALAGFVLAQLGFGFDDRGTVEIGVFVVAATTIVSGLSYVYVWGRRIAGLEHDK
jgi:cardiolipin synthase